jgi:heat shock protein HslJ
MVTGGSNPARAARAMFLTDTAWQVQSYNSGPTAAASRPSKIRRLTATFGADGTINGTAGCNAYRGTYTVDGLNMAVGRRREPPPGR